MRRLILCALATLALASAAQAAAPDVRTAACKKTKFKGEFSCSQAHVNPRSYAIGACGKTEVVSISQSGVVGTTLVSQHEIKREPTAHPGMSATFKAKGFSLWVNMTAPDAKGLFPSDLTENGKTEHLKCARTGPSPSSAK